MNDLENNPNFLNKYGIHIEEYNKEDFGFKNFMDGTFPFNTDSCVNYLKTPSFLTIFKVFYKKYSKEINLSLALNKNSYLNDGHNSLKKIISTDSAFLEEYPRHYTESNIEVVKFYTVLFEDKKILDLFLEYLSVFIEKGTIKEEEISFFKKIINYFQEIDKNYTKSSTSELPIFIEKCNASITEVMEYEKNQKNRNN